MLRALVEKRPVASFVVINYLISWTFLYPCYRIILSAEDGTIPPLALIGFIGAFGPTLAAIIIEGVVAGRQGVRALLRKALIWRVSGSWYVFVLVVPIVLYGIAVWSSGWFGFQPGSYNVRDGISSAVPFFLLALPFGPMGEELGWRGFMLPRLLQEYGPWRSSLLLGVVWTFWHAASFTFPGAAIPSVFEVSIWTVFLYLLHICSETLLMTYVFLKTKGSVLVAILFHAAFNASSNVLLTVFPQIENNVAHTEVIYIFNILLIAILAASLLTSIRTKHGEDSATAIT